MIFAGVESYMFALAVKEVYPSLSTYLLVPLVLIAVMVINLQGNELPRKAQMFITGFLSLAILAIGGFGVIKDFSLQRVEPDMMSINSEKNDLNMIFAAVGVSIFLFMGFDWVTPLGRRKESYIKLIPYSMPLAIVLLLVMYVLIMYAMSYSLTSDEVASTMTPHILLGKLLFGIYGPYIMAILSLLALLTTFNAGLLGASRLIYAVAREGRFPTLLSSISFKTGVPKAAILLIGVSALVLSLIELAFDLHTHAALISASVYCFIYSAVVLAAIRIRRVRRGKEVQFRSPIPVVFQVLIIFIMSVVGIMTLTSDVNLGIAPLIGFMILCITSSFFAHNFSLKTKMENVNN